MNTEEWGRIKELFHAALEQPLERRASFLNEACGRDEAQRARLEEMLRAHESGDSLLDAGPVASGRAPLAPVSPGQRIGNFRIVRELGSGGMGTVFEAEQERPRRRVALKVMHGGIVASSAVRRFQQEAQVLGRLHHPGIAQIYEVGVHPSTSDGAGIPWFSMELISGASLTQHVQKQTPSTRQRVELFVAVCDAVHYAHEQGVIHRDLKPSNILVEPTGQPKILDFGVARFTDSDAPLSTMHTGAGELLGTIAYMSPEQVRGDPSKMDRRSDVYALGVVLYELLTSQLPYPVQNTPLPRAVRLIEEEEPTPPTRHQRGLARDLETIALKALEKEPERRYPTALALAEDLRRFLRDEPILARPASATEQIVKFARRHRTAVAGLVAVFVVLVIGIIGTSVGMLRARHSADEARSESETSSAVGDFLSELLAKGDPLDFRELPMPAPIVARERKLVDVLRESSPMLTQRFLGKPKVEAPLRAAFGRAFFGLGLWKDAEREQQRAIELFREIGGPDDPRALYTEITHILVLEWLGRYDEAERVGAETLAACRRIHGEDDRDTIAVAIQVAHAKGARRDPQAPRDLAAVISRAEPLFGRDDPVVIEANVMQTLLLSYCADDFKAAEACGLDALERIARGPMPNGVLRYGCENFLGIAVANQSDFARALPIYRSSLDGYIRILGADHPWTLMVQGNVGWTLLELGQYEEAERLLRDAAKKLCADDVMGPLHLQTAVVMSNLAKLLERTERYPEAIQWRRGALTAMEAHYSPGHEQIRSAREDLAACLRSTGAISEADALTAQFH
jgi:eukaryotic-like serine/threonine-protein kinase